MERIGVIGGGVIGLATAWRLAQHGYQVTVHDPAPGRGASHVAAGMLAPVGEACFGEEELTALLVASARRWPAFAARLRAVSGLDVGYRDEGSLLVARTDDDLAEVTRLLELQAALGLPAVSLRASALREREPLLAPRIRGGAHAPEDHQVDPRRVVTALLRAAEAAGVRIDRRSVTDLSNVDGDLVVVAAGCGAAELTGLPVRPVKGQLLRLRRVGDGADPTALRHVIRGYVDGRQVYLVPRRDGEIVVGATSEERRDSTLTAGAVLDLLRAAVDLVPELSEYELAEAQVGFRPGTPDNAPIIGELRPGVFVAAGHYRHGIVLAPVTADAIAGLITGGPDGELVRSFGPGRFGAADRPVPTGRLVPADQFVRADLEQEDRTE
jgi:glycine oxidase